MPPPVDASTPVPDELDARVEQMLQQMDRVHDDVVNKLGPAVDEKPASASSLEGEVERALRDAAEAAQVVNKAAEAPPVPQEPVVSPTPSAAPPAPPAPLAESVDPAPASEPFPPPPPSVAAEPAVEEVESVPTETIQELDTQLASAVPATPVDDEFADGASLVEGQSLDVPLPPSSPLGDLPEVVTPTIETPPPAPAPVAPAPQPAPAPAPAPQPVAKPAPVQPPAPKPAPAPVSKPVVPAVIPAPVKPKGPTFADQFWRIATPVVEPIAVRLGKLPVGFQHTVGWIGIVTLFMACATWAYVLFFQETRPLSHILEEQQREQAAAHAGEKGHGEGEGAKGEHGGEGEHAAPANSHGEQADAEKPGAEKSGEQKHTESGSETHGGGESKGHAPEKPAAEKPAKEPEKHDSNEGHEGGGHGGH